MSTLTLFRQLCEIRRTVLLDGGFATALEDAGFDLSTPLWSAVVLATDPSAVESVHEAFAAAGSQIISTGSYQLSAEGCKHEHEGVKDWEHLARLSVWHAAQSGCVVAGSLGPLGAAFHDGSEYTGFYGLGDSSAPVIPITHELIPGRQTLESIRAFHEPRARTLRAAGADLLAFETIPCVLEVSAIAQLVVAMRAEAWISLSVQSDSHLVSGETIADALAAIDAADPDCDHNLAVGVNCCPPQIVEGCVRTMAALLQPLAPAPVEAADAAVSAADAAAVASAADSAAPPSSAAAASAAAAAPLPVDALRLRRRIVVYPNRGEVWDAATGTWKPPVGAAGLSEPLPVGTAGLIELSAVGAAGLSEPSPVGAAGLSEPSGVEAEAEAAAHASAAGATLGAAPAAGTAAEPCADHAPPAACAALSPQAVDEEAWLAMAERWRDAGAWGIGGCCRVSPSMIAALRGRLLPPASAAPSSCAP